MPTPEFSAEHASDSIACVKELWRCLDEEQRGVWTDLVNKVVFQLQQIGKAADLLAQCREQLNGRFGPGRKLCQEIDRLVPRPWDRDKRCLYPPPVDDKDRWTTTDRPV